MQLTFGPENLHTDIFNKSSELSEIMGYSILILGILITPITKMLLDILIAL